MAGGSAAAPRLAGCAFLVSGSSQSGVPGGGHLPGAGATRRGRVAGGTDNMDRKQQIAAALDEARRRTEQLLAPLDTERLTTQYDQLMSPPVWDYAHIGVFEELWLVQRLSGASPIDEDLMQTYDALDTPRRVRGRVPLMSPARTVAYLAEGRQRTLALLAD